MDFIGGALSGIGSFFAGRKIDSVVRHSDVEVKKGLQILANSIDTAVNRADSKMLEALAEFARSKEAVEALGNNNIEGFVTNIDKLVEIAERIKNEELSRLLKRINDIYNTVFLVYIATIVLYVVVFLFGMLVLGSMINPESGKVALNIGEKILLNIYNALFTLGSALIIGSILVLGHNYDLSRRNYLAIKLLRITTIEENDTNTEQKKENVSKCRKIKMFVATGYQDGTGNPKQAITTSADVESQYNKWTETNLDSIEILDVKVNIDSKNHSGAAWYGACVTSIIVHYLEIKKDKKD